MAGQLTIDTLKASSGVLATQNGMTGICKAWVNFNGITTTTIRSSYNVSSVTRTGTGAYTIAFTTAMPSADYAIVASTSPSFGTAPLLVELNLTSAGAESPSTTTAFSFVTQSTGGFADSKYCSVAFFSS